MAKSAQSSYLDLDNSLQKNVFVTQINEREGETFPSKTAFIKDSPDKLIRTGLNTYQETLIVKQEHELDKIDVELYQKRREFQERMARCKEKREKLANRQEALINQMDTFGSFIRENDSKKRRALVRYQSEKRQLQLQNVAYNELTNDIEEYKVIHQRLLEKVQKYKRNQTFLLAVVDLFPTDYIKISDNVLDGLIARHHTLYSNNISLIKDMSEKSEMSHDCARKIAKLKQEHANKMLQNNLKLSELYAEYERVKDNYERAEQEFRMKHGFMRNASLDDGLVLRAIDNIYHKCSRKFEVEEIEDDFVAKLEKIQEHIIMAKQIMDLAKSMKDVRPLSGTPQSQSRSKEPARNKSSKN